MTAERKRPLVAHIIDRLPPDGAERLLADVLRYRSKEWDFTVVCLSEGGPLKEEIEQMGVPVCVLKCRSTWDLRVYRRLRSWIRSNQPDIIHTHLFMADTWGRFLGATSGTRGIMTTVHSTNDWKRVHHRLVDRLLSRWNHAIFACTQAVHDQLATELGENAEARLVTVENGVNIDRVVELSAQECATRDRRIPTIAIVGRLHEAKGHEVLLEALKLMHSEGTAVQLLIIGDGPLRPKLEQLVEESDLGKNVSFLGFQNNPFAWLSEVDVVTMPSLWEGLPMALLEVMALGLPVVASEAGGMGEVIEDGVNGYTIRVGDEKALARKLSVLLSDEKLRQSIGARARQTVSERYDVRRVVDSYEHAYARALGI